LQNARHTADGATEVAMLLSVLIPVYNERRTLASLFEIVCGVLPGVDKELIVVDDCSTDGTRDWLRGNFPDGARSATSVAVEANGNLALAPTESGATVTIRLLYHEHNKGKGGALQTALAAATGDVLVVQDADLEYDPQDWTLKMFTREVKDTLRITCNDFGFELQLGAQIMRARRWRIYEVGIHYYGRTYHEGKKINWKDGVKALWYLIKFRFGREGAAR